MGCRAQAKEMWCSGLVALWNVDLVPWPGIEPMSPALKGRFLTPGSPREVQVNILVLSPSFILDLNSIPPSPHFFFFFNWSSWLETDSLVYFPEKRLFTVAAVGKFCEGVWTELGRSAWVALGFWSWAPLQAVRGLHSPFDLPPPHFSLVSTWVWTLLCDSPSSLSHTHTHTHPSSYFHALLA